MHVRLQRELSEVGRQVFKTLSTVPQEWWNKSGIYLPQDTQIAKVFYIHCCFHAPMYALPFDMISKISTCKLVRLIGDIAEFLRQILRQPSRAAF